MKLLKLKSILFTVVIFVILQSCEKTNSLENRNINNLFKDAEVIPDIGIVHNKLCHEFLNKYDNVLDKKTFEEKNDLIVNFFEEKGYNNIEKYIEPYLFFKVDKGNKSGYEFSPYEFAYNHKENVSEYFYNKLISLLSDVENAGNDTLACIDIINSYKETVLDDTNFDINENEQFYNMLLVYENSISLWYNSDLYLDKTPSENDYWKIASADFVEGMAGGIVGGPVGGAVGIVAGSLTMAISLW